jgi:hypothetical protein
VAGGFESRLRACRESPSLFNAGAIERPGGVDSDAD